MNTAPKLSTDQIEKGWRDTFSVDNPFCPCDLKSFTKAVNWTLRALAPPSGEGVECCGYCCPSCGRCYTCHKKALECLGAAPQSAPEE